MSKLFANMLHHAGYENLYEHIARFSDDEDIFLDFFKRNSKGYVESLENDVDAFASEKRTKESALLKFPVIMIKVVGN